MELHSIAQLLKQTFNPSLIHQAENTLLNERQSQGFITKLLIISDDSQHTIPIRQSALVYIKNAIIDDYNKSINLPDNDFQTVKSSILQALIRNCQEKAITPTIKQIIFVLAEHQFPQNWHDIIPEIANMIQNSSDFNEIFGSIEALKAIVSAVVQKVDLRLTLQNVCNKIILPLLSLSSKLFQNYGQTSSYILISIFKIFSTITNFHIPEIIILNMHSWMIFIKKLLDLNIEAGNIDMNMYQLKKICLRILFRFYQRHMNKKFMNCPMNVIDQFHLKFTKGTTESLLLQIINESHLAKNSTNKNYIQLTKYSLACLSYIYEQDRNAAVIIDHYKQKIIYLCLERYKTRVNKAYSSYGQFASRLNEQRVHLCRFIKGLIINQTKVEEESQKGNFKYNNTNEAKSILACLYNHIEKGDMDMKELCLYIYSNIASTLPENDQQIQSKMLMFILKIVKPLLNATDTQTIIKLRCCELLTKFSYIHLPENQLAEIGGGVYDCLITKANHPDTASMQTFLQIHAVQTFNSLLRYDYIINFTSPYLSNILQVYTSFLEIEVSIIKCLEDMLGKFEPYLQPYGNTLIQMLSDMFFKYFGLVTKFRSGQLKPTLIPNQKEHENQDEDDEESEDGNQSSDNNYLNASKACLGAIRQIIQVPDFTFQKDQIIHNLLLLIFTDREMLYTEEGFNILNQIIFKAQTLKPEYNIYFTAIMFGILPFNEIYLNKLKSENSNYSNALLSMIECQNSDPDPDFLQNTIGCLRNFISKYKQGLRNQIDRCGMSFLDLILTATKYVHENQSTKANQSERSIILTLYMSLIQWKAINDIQLKQILQDVGVWLNMENQLIANQNSSQVNSIKTENKLLPSKSIYSPIYIQIILLAVHFYPQTTLSVINGNWIATETLRVWERLHADYELSRLLIGIADLLDYQAINDNMLSREVMNKLVEAVEKVSKIRHGEESNDLKSVDDEAEEQKFFGMDENTHIMGWNRNKTVQKSVQAEQEMQDEDSSEQEEEDEEFNKYYESGLQSIDEVGYVGNVLGKSSCQGYMNQMRGDLKQKLAFLLHNTAPKFGQQNNQ